MNTPASHILFDDVDQQEVACHNLALEIATSFSKEYRQLQSNFFETSHHNPNHPSNRGEISMHTIFIAPRDLFPSSYKAVLKTITPFLLDGQDNFHVKLQSVKSLVSDNLLGHVFEVATQCQGIKFYGGETITPFEVRQLAEEMNSQIRKLEETTSRKSGEEQREIIRELKRKFLDDRQSWVLDCASLESSIVSSIEHSLEHAKEVLMIMRQGTGARPVLSDPTPSDLTVDIVPEITIDAQRIKEREKARLKERGEQPLPQLP